MRLCSDYWIFCSNFSVTTHFGVPDHAFQRRFAGNAWNAELNPEFEKNGLLDTVRLGALTREERARYPHLRFYRWVQRERAGASQPLLALDKTRSFTFEQVAQRAMLTRELQHKLAGESDVVQKVFAANLRDSMGVVGKTEAEIRAIVLGIDEGDDGAQALLAPRGGLDEAKAQGDWAPTVYSKSDWEKASFRNSWDWLSLISWDRLGPGDVSSFVRALTANKGPVPKGGFKRLHAAAHFPACGYSFGNASMDSQVMRSWARGLVVRSLKPFMMGRARTKDRVRDAGPQALYPDKPINPNAAEPPAIYRIGPCQHVRIGMPRLVEQKCSMGCGVPVSGKHTYVCFACDNHICASCVEREMADVRDSGETTLLRHRGLAFWEDGSVDSDVFFSPVEDERKLDLDRESSPPKLLDLAATPVPSPEPSGDEEEYCDPAVCQMSGDSDADCPDLPSEADLATYKSRRGVLPSIWSRVARAQAWIRSVASKLMPEPSTLESTRKAIAWLSILLTAARAFQTLGLHRWRSKDADAEDDDEGDSQAYNKARKRALRRARLGRKPTPENWADRVAYPQGDRGVDAQVESQLDRLAASVVLVASGSTRMHAFILRGRTMVTTAHFFVGATRMENGSVFKVTYRSNDAAHTVRFAFDPSRLTVHESDGVTRDVATYELHVPMPSFPDISSRLVDNSVVAVDRARSVFLLTFNEDVPMSSVLRYDKTIYWKSGASSFGPVDEHGHCLVSITYEKERHGWCGSPLVAVDPKGRVQLLGMHAAQVRKRGTDILRGLSIALSPGDFVDAAQAQGYDIDGLRAEYEVLGRQDGNEPCAGKSKLEPSVLQPYFPYTHEPALLGHPSDSRSEMNRLDLIVAGLNEFVHSLKIELDPDRAGACASSMYDAYSQALAPSNYAKSWSGRILTLDEALNGVPELQIPRINTSTSPGEGLTHLLKPGQRGKLPFLLQDGDGRLSLGDEAQALYDELTNCLETGTALPEWCVAKCSLKDERRPLSKIRKGKTRLLKIFPMVFNIICKQYFGICHAWMRQGDNECMVGINVGSIDWQHMIERHLRVGDRGTDGDFSCFQRYFTEDISRFLYEGFYEPFHREHGELDAHKDLRARLFSECLVCTLLVQKFYVRSIPANHSGIFGTTERNCLVVGLLMRYAWLEVARRVKPSWATMTHFERWVVLSTYGDDHIQSRHELVSWYNFPNIRDAMSSMGITYTAANKEENAAPDKRVLDLDFLKLTTREDSIVPGVRYYAAPHLPDLYPTLCWVTRGLPGAIHENADACLRRAFGCGRDTFETLRRKIKRAFASAELSANPITFETCISLFQRRALSFDAMEDEESDPCARIPKPEWRGLRARGLDDFDLSRHRGDIAYAQGDLGVEFEGVEAKAPVLNGSALPDDAATDEMRHSFQSILAIPRHVANYNWTTVDARGAVLASHIAPWSFLRATQYDAVAMFSTLRGTMRFRILLQSQPFQQGKLIVAFFPQLSDVEAQALASESIQNSLVNPHVMLEAGATREAVLEIPYQHVLRRLDPTYGISGFRHYNGTFVMSVFNTLLTGPDAVGSALSASISVFFSMPDAELAIVEAVPSVSRAALSKHEPSADGGWTAVPQGAGLAAMRKAHNVGGVALDAVDEAASIVKGDGDMDYPNVSVEGVHVIRDPTPNLANTSGVSGAVMLDTHAAASVARGPEGMGHTTPDMNFEAFFSKPGLLTTLTWNDTDPPGTVLYQGRMNPCPLIEDVAVGGDVTPTPTGFAMYPFEFWGLEPGGALVYTVEVVRSKFHTGRLAFITSYRRTIPIGLSNQLGQYASVVDVEAESSSYTFRVPWESVQELLRVPFLGAARPFSETSLGFWGLVIVNELRAPVSVSPSVEVNVYMNIEKPRMRFLRDISCGLEIDMLPRLGPAAHHDDAKAQSHVECKRGEGVAQAGDQGPVWWTASDVKERVRRKEVDPHSGWCADAAVMDHCLTCNVHFSGLQSAEQHLMGPRHSSRESFRRSDRDGCRLCNVPLLPSSHAAHFRGKAHSKSVLFRLSLGHWPQDIPDFVVVEGRHRRNPVDAAVAQGDSLVDDPSEIAAVAPDQDVHTLGFESKGGATPLVPVQPDRVTLQETVKRASTFLPTLPLTTGTAYPVADVFSTGPAGNAAGYLSYFAQSYRYWQGSMKWTIVGKTNAVATYSPASDQDSCNAGLLARMADYPRGPTGTGPLALGVEPVRFLQVATPFQSEFPWLLTPQVTEESRTVWCSSGSFVLGSPTNDLEGRVTVAAGDNFQFSRIYRLPRFIRL